MMENLSDESLVALFAQGKDEAFDVLLERYQSKLMSYIMLVVQNRDVADDIFQDTFTKVIVTVKSGRYHETGRFVGYLFRIAHNRIIDSFRQEQNSPCISEGERDYDIFNNLQLTDASYEDTLAARQVQRDIRRLIMSLPENQREVVIMRYYKNLSFKEIAELTHVSINTALGRMRYAILNIRKMAQEHHIALAV
jgi:RNA polymerase sigma-70 factor (ECF subfamily)